MFSTTTKRGEYLGTFDTLNEAILAVKGNLKRGDEGRVRDVNAGKLVARVSRHSGVYMVNLAGNPDLHVIERGEVVLY